MTSKMIKRHFSNCAKSRHSYRYEMNMLLKDCIYLMREWTRVITGSKEKTKVRCGDINQVYLRECIHGGKSGFFISWQRG